MFATKFSSIHYPNDLCLLKRVYDRICAEQELAPESHQAASLAERALALFAAGLFEEDELYERLSGQFSSLQVVRNPLLQEVRAAYAHKPDQRVRFRSVAR